MDVEGDDRSERAYRVFGRVQGVGFRWWTRGVAEELGVGGTVRNLPDGSVEVSAYGPGPILDELERRLRRGPAIARVDAVKEVAPLGVQRPHEFRVLP